MNTNEILRDRDDSYIDIVVNDTKNTATLFLENKDLGEQVSITMTLGEMEEMVSTIQELIKR